MSSILLPLALGNFWLLLKAGSLFLRKPKDEINKSPTTARHPSIQYGHFLLMMGVRVGTDARGVDNRSIFFPSSAFNKCPEVTH